jgi:hypothetical protein
MKPELNLALAELHRSRDVALHNAPLYDLAGDVEQAKLCWQVALQCLAASDLIQRLEAERRP